MLVDSVFFGTRLENTVFWRFAPPLCLSLVSLAASLPKTADCFKVYSLIRMDQDHYWANWANTCPYTVDSVYVMVKFTDKSNRSLGTGLWAMHFVTPGTHQVTRFTSPRDVADFDFVQVRKITTDSEEALLERPPLPEPPPKPGVVPDPGPVAAAIALANQPVLPSIVAPAVDIAAEHNRRGREFVQAGRYSEAIAEFSEALRQKSDFPLALNARGYAYYLQHDYRHSLADFDEAIRLNPTYVNAYQNRSRARKASGDTTGSAEDANKARTLQNTNN